MKYHNAIELLCDADFALVNKVGTNGRLVITLEILEKSFGSLGLRILGLF